MKESTYHPRSTEVYTHAAIVLAGGKSSRMGTNKALLPVGNTTVLERTISIMRTLCEAVLISGPLEWYQDFGCRVIEDPMPEMGPLMGLSACMSAHKADYYWVVTCDLPFLEMAVYEQLWAALDDSSQVVYAVTGGQMHPLVAIYRHDFLETIQFQIATEQLGVWRAIHKATYKEVDFGGETSRFFYNMNSMKEYQEISEMKTQKITLLYFGIVGDIIGRFTDTLEWTGTVGELQKKMLAEHPDLAHQQIRYSVNRVLVNADHAIADGDEIALLPPFAGG